ncbi:MAG: replicative DNA helicase [Anaerolineaceae bacterium]|nr:replicative DNA helicase [Anaerolineaceae bacterium]
MNIDMDPSVPEEINQVPHSREAEEAVLGAILINPEKYFDVSQIINSRDFYIHRNRWVWEAYGALFEKGQAIDVQTVCEELDAKGHLGEVGGKVFFYNLTSKTPSSMHAESYANIVLDKSQRRSLIEAGQKMIELAYDSKKELNEVLGESEEMMVSISEKRDRKEIIPITDVLSNVYDQVRLLYQKGEDIVGVPSGLIDLDRLLGGFQKSDLIIVAGRPGMGKTGFMLTVLRNAALRAKKRVAMFSLEMSNEQLVHRLISQQTGISTQKLRTGKLTNDDLTFFIEAIDILGETKIFLDDTPAITPMQLRSKCRRLHMEHHLDLIIIDYLQLMTGDSGNDNRVQEVSSISRALKMLAKDLDVPVLTAAQLSRGVERRDPKEGPMLSDLRESGSLEQDADIVMFLHNPNVGQEEEHPELEGAMKLIVRKNRHGEVKDIDLVFLKNQARFENAARID